MEITIRSDVFGLSSTKHLRRNAVLHPVNDLVMMWWLCHLISQWGVGLNTSDLTQRSGFITRIASDLVRHTKNTLVLYRVWSAYDTYPHDEESSWAQWGKNFIGKKNLSIELSEVNMWLVWILTTKRKSLKRVEICQKKHFNFWLFCYVNSFFRINLQTGFYSLDIYILWICSALNPWLFVCIWMTLFWSRVWKDTWVWRIAPVLHTVLAYWKCAIIPIGLHWAAMVMIISSCLDSNCYPVSYMRCLSHDYCCNW